MAEQNDTPPKPKRKRKPYARKPQQTAVLLRRYRSLLDIETHTVYREAIMSTAPRYSPKVLQQWMGNFTMEHWHARMTATHVLVANTFGQSVGIVDIDEEGYVDLLYVSPLIARRGMGSAMLTWAQRRAMMWDLPEMTTVAPEATVPFFVGNGFRVVQPEMMRRGNAMLKSYAMTKRLTGLSVPPVIPPDTPTLKFITGDFPIYWESGTMHPMDEADERRKEYREARRSKYGETRRRR